MNQPLTLLVIFSLFTVILVLVVKYRAKIRKKISSYSSSSERIFIEDALKHLYDYEYKNLDATIDSLAGNMSIPGNQAARIIERLSELGLINYEKEKLRLTPSGRSYALKVIRIHRLWERYLAEETSVPVEEWHNHAELKEHKITEREADEISAKLGNPIYDPHGDPIPTKKGEIPEFSGLPLNEMNINDYCLITHIEDEPKHIYQQLSVLGLRRGMQIRILHKDSSKIVLEVEGEEVVLALPFTQNITVKKIDQPEEILEEFETLDKLQLNEEAEIIGISNALIGQQRRRLLDLGIVPGTKVKAKLQGVGKDPTAYVVRETTIALRKEISKWIYIRKVNKNAA